MTFQDRGTPMSLNSTTTLVVKVEDQSDQPPEFVRSSYRADIAEEASVVSKGRMERHSIECYGID